MLGAEYTKHIEQNFNYGWIPKKLERLNVFFYSLIYTYTQRRKGHTVSIRCYMETVRSLPFVI